MQGVRSEGRLHEVNNLLWYRRLLRNCIKHADSRPVKLLLLADLKRVQAAIKAGPFARISASLMESAMARQAVKDAEAEDAKKGLDNGSAVR